MKKTALLLSFVIATVLAMAQGSTDLILTQQSSGGTYSMQVSDESYYLNVYDESDAEGNYLDGPFNRWVTIDSGTCEGVLGMSLYFKIGRAHV